MAQQLAEPIEFGKYTLYERIGRGGMADVFKGRIQGPEGFERVFVIKRILPNLSDDPAFIRMFVEEAKLSARLNHPNIVQIFELGTVEGELFISMEYVPGHDLSETMRALWKTSGAPRPDLVAYIGREMCRALAYAHNLTDDRGQLLGMIHRDVSPSNVMLSFEGGVKLLDFGIAKALADNGESSTGGTTSGTLKGKYAYMAPEQTEGDNVDHRIDVFAAGIVLHEVLTGRRLFKGANDIQTIERVRRCDVRPPSQMNPACPPELDAVLLRALQRNRDDRFQSASDMAEALDEIVHAAHFTPGRMAAIMRETFGGEAGPAGAADRRIGTSTTNTTVSPTTSSARRSPTVPPIELGARGLAEPAALPGAPVDSALLRAIRPRPLWRRASFWVVFALCAGGVGTAVVRGVGKSGARPPAEAEMQVEAPVAAIARRPKLVPVLIQSDPEGAEIFVAGKLESQGKTPVWLSLEMDAQNPARVMLRKVGFEDKAIAVEVERPPMVQMIPNVDPTAPAAIELPGAHGPGAPATAGNARPDFHGDAKAGMHRGWHRPGAWAAAAGAAKAAKAGAATADPAAPAADPAAAPVPAEPDESGE